MLALDPSWNKNMHDAIKAGRKDEFLRAENGKASMQIQTQKEIFRREFPDLAKELDKGKGAIPGQRPLPSLTTTIVAVCHLCGIGEEALSEKLKLCSKCKAVRYCSAACQKIDWKVHETTCGTGKPPSNPSLHPPISQLDRLTIATLGPPPISSRASPPADPSNPFEGPGGYIAWLENQSEELVCRLLLDSYRLRIATGGTIKGDIPIGSPNSGANLIIGFNKFLTRAEKNSHVLPYWWNGKVRSRCEAQARAPLQSAFGESDILNKFSNPLTPHGLKYLAKKTYGEIDI